MSILGAIIVPYPPLIIPAVGRGREREVQATIGAYRTAESRRQSRKWKIWSATRKGWIDQRTSSWWSRT